MSLAVTAIHNFSFTSQLATGKTTKEGKSSDDCCSWARCPAVQRREAEGRGKKKT